MNKLVDAMWAEVSPEMQAHALELVATVTEAMCTPQLLPEKIRAELPPLGATEAQADPFALVKFFTPDGNWTWYAFEFDGDDTFYGFVRGEFDELGYFSLRELQEARGHLGLPVERDEHFEATPLSALR